MSQSGLNAQASFSFSDSDKSTIPLEPWEINEICEDAPYLVSIPFDRKRKMFLADPMQQIMVRIPDAPWQMNKELAPSGPLYFISCDEGDHSGDLRPRYCSNLLASSKAVALTQLCCMILNQGEPATIYNVFQCGSAASLLSLC